jgi:hypothetical protein
LISSEKQSGELSDDVLILRDDSESKPSYSLSINNNRGRTDFRELVQDDHIVFVYTFGVSKCWMDCFWMTVSMSRFCLCSEKVISSHVFSPLTGDVLFPTPSQTNDERTRLLLHARRECRGIVFNRQTHQLLSRRMHKFFNSEFSFDSLLLLIYLSPSLLISLFILLIFFQSMNLKRHVFTTLTWINHLIFLRNLMDQWSDLSFQREN